MISDRLQAFIIYASSHGLMDDHESPVQPYVRDWDCMQQSSFWKGPVQASGLVPNWQTGHRSTAATTAEDAQNIISIRFFKAIGHIRWFEI